MFKLIGKGDKVRSGLKRSKESWVGMITQILHRQRLDESLWEELEELLVTADVGMPTTALVINRVKEKTAAQHVIDPGDVIHLLKQEMVQVLHTEHASHPIFQSQTADRPLVILVIGVNGVGKTTSIAKLGHYLKENGHGVILAASDTFRAGAIEQIQSWGERLGIDVISHGPGGDPAAIAYDALEAARARSANVVLVDTAGRLHTKLNLMEEMKKICRVLSRLDPDAPHDIILVLDATIGQNGLAQARAFAEAVKCTGVFLAKLDGTAKGGVVMAIVQELGLPVLFIGTGESVEDMAPFDAVGFVEELFSPVSSD